METVNMKVDGMTCSNCALTISKYLQQQGLNNVKVNPLDGDVFVFLNKPRNTIKLLHWERDGLVIYHKRLENGTFPPPQIEANQTQIRWPELVLMLEGITATKLKRKPRFSLNNP